jgi:hypothetical protein
MNGEFSRFWRCDGEAVVAAYVSMFIGDLVVLSCAKFGMKDWLFCASWKYLSLGD